jgi:ubiquinone/menaquinone biosynthesis C-methylase UbiE
VKSNDSSSYIRRINQHYAQEGLGQVSIAAVKDALRDTNGLTVERMLTFDQLHIGGRSASLRLARQARLSSIEKVLDAGCGLGGSSRLLARYFGSQVFGMDLTAPFCRLAHRLSRTANLDGLTFFLRADLNRLPVREGTFDVVWAQHILMNVREKGRLLSEFARILKPSGRLLVHEVVKGDNQPVHYPVPWAADASLNYLCSAASLESKLHRAQFHIGTLQDESASALAWFAKRALSAVPERVLPPQAPENANRRNAALIRGNVWHNLKENRIRVVQGVFQLADPTP